MFNKNKLMIAIMMVMLIALVPAVFGDMLPAYNQNSCVEDDGLNYDVKGFAKGPDENTGVFAQYYDSCATYNGDKGKEEGWYIAETHCSQSGSENYVHTQWTKCKLGCYDGQCIPELNDMSCTDTDGSDIYTKGTVTGVNDVVLGGLTSATDKCVGSTLKEYICSNNNGIGYPSTVALQEKFCENGCSNGKCLKESIEPVVLPSCYDTDGGNNIYKKGTITYDNGKISHETCSSPTQVIERYCNNGEMKVVNTDGVKCPNGYGCSDGACVPSNVPQEMPTEDLPDLAVMSLNYDTNNYRAKVCNIGDKSVSNFMITFQAKDIQNDLYYVPTITPGNCVDIYSWAYSYFGLNADNVKNNYVGVYLDNNGNIKEKSEANNFFDKPATSTTTPTVIPTTDDEYSCVDVNVYSCVNVNGGIKIMREKGDQIQFLSNECREDPQWGWKNYQSYCVGSTMYKACSKPCEPVQDVNYNSVCPSGYYAKESYAGNCKERPEGMVCLGFDDKFKWFVEGPITSWTKNGNVQISHQTQWDYYHILNTNCVMKVTSGTFVEEFVEEVDTSFDNYEFYKEKLQYGECADPDGGFNPKVKGWAYGYNVWNEGYLSWGDYCTETPDGAQQNEGGSYLHEAECMAVTDEKIEVRYQKPIKCKYGCGNGVCLDDGSFDYLDDYDYGHPMVEDNSNGYPIPVEDIQSYGNNGPSFDDSGLVESNCNSGCMYNEKCLPFGTKKVNGKPLFCDIDSVFKTQKSDGMYCDNSFECKSNFCSNSQCVDIEGELRETKGLLKRILSWLDKLF
jgi:hypothetical protein